MTERILPHTYSPQETGWWCGPASVQIALTAKGIHISERDLMHELEALEGNVGWDDRDGTDYVGQVATVMSRHTGLNYVTRGIPNDPPTRAQQDLLWDDVVRSINAGNPLIANIVAPPGSTNPPMYPDNQTIWHYFVLIGYKDVGNGRHVRISDPANFGGIGEYWLTLENLAVNIAGKGYTACPTGVSAPLPGEPQPERTSWDAVMEQFIGPKA